MLKSIATEAQENSVFVADAIVPFPISKSKAISKQPGTLGRKEQGEFFKVVSEEQQSSIAFPADVVPKMKSVRPSNELHHGAEVTNFFNRENPDGPTPTKMLLGQKPKRIDARAYNSNLAENLETLPTADLGQEIDAEVRDHREEKFLQKTKKNMAKTKRIVYKSTDLFEREQGTDFFENGDSIDHLKTKDGRVLGEPFVQSSFLQTNEGFVLRMDPRIELHKQKVMKARAKQDQQRQEDKLYAQQVLSSRANQ